MRLRVFYQIVNWLQGIGGDEALIAHYMNVSPQIVSAVFIAAFGIALVIAFRAIKGWKMRVKWLAALLLEPCRWGRCSYWLTAPLSVTSERRQSIFRLSDRVLFSSFPDGLCLSGARGLIAYQWEKSLTPTVPT